MDLKLLWLPYDIRTSLSLCKVVGFFLGTCCCDLAIAIVWHTLKQLSAVKLDISNNTVALKIKQ